mgnify:CR=1 FL=1
MKFNEFLTENPMIFDMERDELDDLYTKRRDVEKFNGKKLVLSMDMICINIQRV